MNFDTKKIEDFLEKVSTSISFDPLKTSDKAEPQEELEPPKTKLTFPRILDFSFPSTSNQTNVVQLGEIIYVGDGVVHIVGLDKATIDEVVEIQTIKGKQKALILGILENRIEAVVLGDYTVIRRGDAVKASGARLKVPVGKGLLGRVINPLGIPLDGLGPIKKEGYRDVEFAAPGVLDRKPIEDPMHTGVMVIDTTIPVGRGQRELVIGDRKTGKSRTLLDVICNQKGKGVFCVYVGVGIQAAKAKATLRLLKDRGALAHTMVVVALANEPPSLQYIAPYVGAALAEHFMYQGKHSLIVYDDLSKQAKAYRQVSLLLKRSPGRDAYPGDIFFLHSRLLERASMLSDDLSGGSMTALPIAETQGGDVSDYIITNLMSITDGHIYLDSNLMHEGILPAVNSGTSVSRIGGKVQTPMLRKVGELAGRILARYNEVKSFETINTEVAEETLRDIKRGKRVKEILSQDSDLNMSPDEQVVSLGIATSSRMDHLELTHSTTFRDHITEFYRQWPDKQEFAKLADTVKDMAEIDPLLDKLFKDFSKEYKLPILETSSSI